MRRAKHLASARESDRLVVSFAASARASKCGVTSSSSAFIQRLLQSSQTSRVRKFRSDEARVDGSVAGDATNC